jgi:Methyltransferase domain
VATVNLLAMIETHLARICSLIYRGKGKVTPSHLLFAVTVSALCLVLPAIRDAFPTTRYGYDYLRPSCDLSMNESYQYVCADNEKWNNILREERKQFSGRTHLVEDVKGILGKYNALNSTDVEWFLNLREFLAFTWVPTISCPDELRIGEPGDGGKWVCGMSAALRAREQAGDCLIYSFGSNNQFEFEVEMSQRLSQNSSSRCEMHVFDHTVKNWRIPALDNIHVHSWGVTSVQDASRRGAPFKSFHGIRQELGHSQRRLTILKIDIEHSEYEVIPEVLKSTFAPEQILLELHVSLNGQREDVQLTHNIRSHLRAESYAMFHSEWNYFSTQGNCLEYAFLRIPGLLPIN